MWLLGLNLNLSLTKPLDPAARLKGHRAQSDRLHYTMCVTGKNPEGGITTGCQTSDVLQQINCKKKKEWRGKS